MLREIRTFVNLSLLNVGQSIGLQTELILENFVFFQDQIGLPFDMVTEEASEMIRKAHTTEFYVQI